MAKEMIYNVSETADRLDKYVAEQTGLSRSHIKNTIASGGVKVNGKTAKPSDKLHIGDVVIVRIPEPQQIEAVPQDIPVDIVYQDGDIAVVNKPQGMVVHPAPGNIDGTLVNALLFHLKDLSGINGEIRPGIVHRIDKDTSGLLVIAKNDDAHISLQQQIGGKAARRIYAAIVHGNIKEDEVTVDKPIARSKRDRKKMAVDVSGRDAVTHFRVVERFGDYTYVEAELETGRTHQIRVHAAAIHHPVAGDAVYGPKKVQLHRGGQLLHAKMLTLCHPRTGEAMVFEAPLPDYFEKTLTKLRGRT